MIAAEVALGTVLAIGSGLLLASLYKVMSVPRGFDGHDGTDRRTTPARTRVPAASDPRLPTAVRKRWWPHSQTRIEPVRRKGAAAVRATRPSPQTTPIASVQGSV